ncbi:MAG TPA: glycosyltransferase family 2 protein [Thermoanaerobaculia bacterium]|nr:glycosyltransferase family 2 protein [Thermoanaerobaculia bacterium]
MNLKRAWADDSEIFRHRRAAPIRMWERVLIAVLIFLALQSVVFFGVWWFRLRNVSNPALFVLLSIATWYGIFRMFVGWYNLFHLEHPPAVPAPEGLSVAIFTTSSPGEPYEMFVRTLEAARRITYPHTTYLLDDTGDPRFAVLAAEMGAVHLELIGYPGAKAGKINEALKRTKEDFILVLDPDHIPFPMFLDRVLGYFQDESVGFVQVSQAYYNPPESFVARAAAEQTFTFYGPIMQGMNGTGTAVAIGANCTFRRTALESIGGHGIGLAEDLVTSIRLHAAGWESVYVPEIVSRGLVPSDLGSFLKQQLKWSRGVHEVLFHEYPRAFRKLSFHQKISYFMIGSYYLVGLTSFIYFTIPLLYLWVGAQPAAMILAEYLEHAIPLALLGLAIYRLSQRWLCDPARERGWHWRGTLLKIGAWNVFLRGLWFAVRGIDVPYIPTAKERKFGEFWRLSRLPLGVIAISAVTVAIVVYRRLFVLDETHVRITTEATWAMAGFLIINSIFMSGRLWAAWQDRVRREPEE